MNLTFLNPLFLFGLAAGILPILIHRLVRRKAIPRKFSAVHLLLQSQRVMARPERLKHLLLLALRVLAVTGLIVLMTRPVLTSPGLLALGDEGAKAIILDNSLSMSFREERGERYDLAKKAAKEVIEGLKGKVMVIPTAPVPGRSVSEGNFRWVEPPEALKELARIPLSFGRGDPNASMGLAYRQLKDLKMPGEILIITDMTRGDWETLNLSQLGTVVGGVSVSFLTIGGPNRDANLAIKGVRLVEGEAVVGVPVRFEVTVSNLSDKSGSTLAQFFLSQEKVDQKSIELKAGEEGKVNFQLSLDKAGWVNGEVRLSGDSLPLDDHYYFPFIGRDRIKVLIVDGDPRTSLKAGESYYLANALNPRGSEGSAFLTKVITEEELANADVKPYDAVFLLNLAKPTVFKVASILESDKIVFIFLGDRVIPEEYNRLPFLPWKIGEAKETEPLRPERISQIDDRRKALKALLSTGSQSLKGASFRHYFRIRGSSGNLLALGNRDPLLVEADLGKGKVFMFASSADLDWNDLPLKAAYLPLIQGLVKEAVGLSEDSLPERISFGEPFQEKGAPAQVAGDQGGPGIYRFILPSGEVRRGVNLPLEESDLGKVSEEEIRKKFGTIRTKIVEYREGTLGGLKPGAKELWPFLLGFVLVVLVVEMAVANRIPKANGYGAPHPTPLPPGERGGRREA